MPVQLPVSLICRRCCCCGRLLVKLSMLRELLQLEIVLAPIDFHPIQWPIDRARWLPARLYQCNGKVVVKWSKIVRTYNGESREGSICSYASYDTMLRWLSTRCRADRLNLFSPRQLLFVSVIRWASIALFRAQGNWCHCALCWRSGWIMGPIYTRRSSLIHIYI